MRKCYPAMSHAQGDVVRMRDCILLKSGTRPKDLPFVAKVSALWENADDGEMMMSLLWYYRPEHTEAGRRPPDLDDEIFASKHRDVCSVACIEDKCYVLTFNEYCRYIIFFFSPLFFNIKETNAPGPSQQPKSMRFQRQLSAGHGASVVERSSRKLLCNCFETALEK